MCFSGGFLYKLPVFSRSLKYPEAMIDDSLKSDKITSEIIINNLICEIISLISARNSYNTLYTLYNKRVFLTF